MALTITYINERAPSPKVRSSVRLWETADRQRLVPDGHPEAAFLFCTEGQEVSQQAFEAHELDATLESEVVQTEREAEAVEPEPELEEKALPGPPEDKAVHKRRTKRTTTAKG